MTNNIKLIAGNLLLLVALLAILELVLRTADIGSYGAAPINPDRVFHHVHPGDYRFVNYSLNNDFGAVNVLYDQYGMRISDEDSLQNRNIHSSIAFLGDSFVESNQVSYDSSFIGRLQNQFPEIAMQNYGVSSYSPAINYLIVKNKILNRQPLPSKVFLLLYSNDVRDDETYLANAVFDETEEITAIDGGEPSALISLLRSSNLFRILRKAQLTLAFMWKNNNKEKKEQKVVSNQVEENPDWEGTQSARYVLKTAKLLASNNIRFYLMVVPSKYNDYFVQYDNLEFSDKVHAWAEKNNLAFIDLASSFQQWRSSHNQKLFFHIDIHFNNSGQEVVARTLAPYIPEDNLQSCNTLTYH